MNRCCIIGHRNIEITQPLIMKLQKQIEDLILEKDVTTFLFGSKSHFTSLCYKIISELKNKYPSIKRVFVRAEFPEINDEYYSHLLNYYEESFFTINLPKQINFLT